MTKITTPLLSLAARGSLGNAISFRRRGSITVVEKKPRPFDLKSLVQIYHRWDYQDICSLWQALTAAQKHTWLTNARRLRITGFNYFMGTYLLTRPHLAAHWPLDTFPEGPGYDRSPNANHGTAFGTVEAHGLVDTARSFDGIDDRIEIADLIAFGTESFSIEMLVLTQSVAATNYLIDARHFPITMFWKSTDRFGWFVKDSDGVTANVNSASTYPYGWHHLAMLIDRTNNKLYCIVDGVVDTEHDVTFTGHLSPTNPFYIGCYKSGAVYGGWSKATIDNVIIFTTPPPLQQLLAHSKRRYPL